MNNTDNKRTEEDKVTDMITAEDLVEQALYAANAPDCCTAEEKAKNMLAMLGANVSDETVYHDEGEHMKKTVLDRLDKEYGEFRDNMLRTKTAEQIFYSANEISMKTELCATLENMDEDERVFESLYVEDEKENLLSNLFAYSFMWGESIRESDETTKILYNYCNEYHPEIMEREEEPENSQETQLDI